MGGLRAFIILQLIYMSTCNDQLKVMYEWNELDYEFPSLEERQQAIDNLTFIPKKNVPMGLEVYGNKLFITVTRWRHGVASTLNYIDLSDNSTNSPKLKPYPNWEAHSFKSGRPEIVSPFRMRVDKCSRLWVMDSGKISRKNKEPNAIYYPPAILIFDLKTDTLIRRYEFPEDQLKEKSTFSNIAVEDTDCHNTFAYAADHGAAAIVVYSWAKNDSWRISHHYFNIDPLACNFEVNGYNFSWTDGVLGMGLSAPNADNYRTLYFHPMSSFNEFSVSTEYLQNKTLAENNFDAFKLLGSRGPKSQSCPSFVDQKTGVLFYSVINLNAVACWRTSNKEYNMKNQGRIFMNNETMIFPSDIKVDYNDNLWVLSNKLPLWMYRDTEEGLDPNEVNFRVFSAPVLEAISHTACDVTPRSDIMDKFIKNMKATEPVDIHDPHNSAYSLISFSANILLLTFLLYVTY